MTRMVVSPRTFAAIQAASYHVMMPGSGLGVGALTGVKVEVSKHVADGQVLVFEDGKPVRIETVELEPDVPVGSPYDRVATVKEDTAKPGVWVARDAGGEVLMELTERGARDLAARRGLRLG